MARWGDEKTLLFITYYREHECLWNPSSPLYKNKIARENAYMSLLQQINDDSLTVKFIKTKIKNLRTTYHQELNKIKHFSQPGAHSSQVYKPSICWFEEMDSFLGESLQNRPTISTEMENSAITGQINANITYNNSQYLPVPKTAQRPSESTQNKPLSTHQSDIQPLGQTAQRDPPSIVNNLELNQTSQLATSDQEPTTRKHTRLVTNKISTKKRTHSQMNAETSSALNQYENISKIISTLKAGEDEFHFFGMNIAAQLRRLPLHVALQLQTEFQNSLYLARVRNQADDTSKNYHSDTDLPQTKEQSNVTEIIPQNVKEELSP